MIFRTEITVKVIRGFLLTTVLSISTTSTEAQYRVGLEGGMNLSMVQRSSVQNEENAKGISIAVHYRRRINDHLYLGTGLVYQERGYMWALNYTDMTGEPTGEGLLWYRKFRYVGVDCYGGYTSDGRIGVKAEVGVLPAYLVSGSTIYYDFTTNNKGRKVLDETYHPKLVLKDFRRFDLSGIARIGLFFHLTDRMTLTLISGFQYSLTSFEKGRNAYHYLFPLQIGAEFLVNPKGS